MSVKDFTAFHSRLRLMGALRLKTALRIGAGRAGGAAEIDLPALKDVMGRPYIPGSSFKGALRAHVERLLRGLQERLEGVDNLACLSISKPEGEGNYEGCLTARMVQDLKVQEKYVEDPQALDDLLWERSCWVCRLFGAPWLASKVWIRDLLVIEDSWLGRYLRRDGVAIDRDTGTAGQRLKYDFEAVPAGVAFDFELVAENATEAEQGLLLLGLRDFERGRVAIGSSRSRGLGWVQLDVDWDGSEYVDGDSLLDYLLGTVDEARLRVLSDAAVREERLKTFLREAGVKSDA